MKEAELDKYVLQYLHKRGYRSAEAALRNEASAQELEDYAFELSATEEASVSNYILFYNANENNPNVHDESFRSLTAWVDESLDMYKPELRSVLYPIFVHLFLDLVSKNFVPQARTFMDQYKSEFMEQHRDDLLRLPAVTDIHLSEGDVVAKYREHKYTVRMCAYSFELLLSFLQDRHLMLLLRILNQHINIEVFSGQPQAVVEDLGVIPSSVQTTETTTVAGSGDNTDQATTTAVTMDSINAKPILWGHIELDPYADKKRDLDPVKKTRQQEIAAAAPPPDRIPRPSLREEDKMIEGYTLEDLRHMVSLGPSALPSICCYTFHNAQDSLTSVALSHDSAWMSSGYADSSIQVHSLRGDTIKTLKSGVELMNQSIPPGATVTNFQVDTKKTSIKMLGHSGPVYSTSFSHDNKFLLSSSEDGTSRLFSLETHTNVVAYKGHNYPVWDCDFSPFSFYFATGSHDRTARLWSCDHIYPLRIFAGHLSDVDVVKFHPNANYVATGSSDRTVRLWDVQKGSAARIFLGHTAAIHALAFSPDGRYLASAGEDMTVCVWDLASGKRLNKLLGHKSIIHSLSFSFDGSVIASGSADRTVRIWDATRIAASNASPLVKTEPDQYAVYCSGGCFLRPL